MNVAASRCCGMCSRRTASGLRIQTQSLRDEAERLEIFPKERYEQIIGGSIVLKRGATSSASMCEVETCHGNLGPLPEPGRRRHREPAGQA